MSREEAIKVLFQHIEHWKRLLTENICSKEEGSQTVEALEMAIKALSQEPICDRDCEHCTWTECPIEPCDDAISREDAVHALRKALWDYEDKTEKQFRERDDLDYEEWYFHRIFVQAMNDEDVEAICKLPSVTQKSGKWIYRAEDKYSCSKCGTTTRVDEAGIDEKPMYKFCPYCGAKMVEPQESEDKE